ncbi:kalirin-like, partial [Amblyraja radiata]|uniref:kalirin-like n=1 Tax=Amblyraja radiata TaxID=386614 RepID=UPI0014031F2F
MKSGHQRSGCACHYLFRKVLAKCGCCYRVRESYSVRCSDGSISTSVASAQPQPSTSSAPSSPGSKRSVSTLKKWLTSPVRKLSGGGGGGGTNRRVKKLECKAKKEERRRSADSQRRSIDLGIVNRGSDVHDVKDRKDGPPSPQECGEERITEVIPEALSSFHPDAPKMEAEKQDSA